MNVSPPGISLFSAFSPFLMSTLQRGNTAELVSIFPIYHPCQYGNWEISPWYFLSFAFVCLFSFGTDDFASFRSSFKKEKSLAGGGILVCTAKAHLCLRPGVHTDMDGVFCLCSLHVYFCTYPTRDRPNVVAVSLENCGGSVEQFKLDQKGRRRVWKMELLRKDHVSRWEILNIHWCRGTDR